MTEPLPQSLIDARARGSLIPFVGAGVSMAVRAPGGAAAFPSWKGLLKFAAKRLGEEGREQKAIVEAMLGQRPPEYLAAAHYAQKGLGPLWPGFLREALGIERNTIDASTLALARAVWRLGSKLVITTNYDRVLRWACPEPDDLDEWSIEATQGLVEARRGQLRRPTVWHLHGSVTDAAKIILSPDGYALLYPSDGHQVSYQAALESLRALMVDRHFVFVGFSLDDEFFVRQLEWVAETFGGLAGPHYVLTPERDMAAMSAKVAGLGVQAVAFAEFGRPLVELVERIAGNVRPVGPPTEAPPKSSKVVTSPANPNLEPGQVLIERYRLIEKLGRGGFATVWQALDLDEHRLVAVKALHVQWAAERGRVDRFRAGAEALKRLDHPAIAPVIEGPHRDGHHHFFVMPWFRGEDLRRALARGLDRNFALLACARAIEGLAHAHSLGLVHRDVKPDNILVDGTSQGWIADFDLVRDEHASTGMHTNAGMGTFVYAAPEQHKHAQHADARADVYGAGMTALFVLLGEDPPPMVILAEPHRIERAACDARLRAAIKGAVAYDRMQRTTTCEGLATAIREYVLTVAVPRPAWAHDAGVDEYGTWATFRVGAVEQKMRWIPPGRFLMGSPESEKGRWEDEGPQHEVTFTRGYWLADTPCTQALWIAVMGSNPSGFQQSTRLPVENVSWDDVQEFLVKLNTGAEGPRAGLPTEAQWEYACRARTTEARYGELGDVAWYEVNSEEKTHEVAQKRANGWGLHDMLGNVWEWCADTGGSYEARASEDPPTREHGPKRVFRGGSWHVGARSVRAAHRLARGPGSRYDRLGFRLVRGQ